MSRPKGGSARSFVFLVFFLFMIFLGLLAFSPAAGAKTITITVVFKYRAPDGTDKPIRYAYVELRDSDSVSDDIIARSSTELDGSARFQYDSGMGDGVGGGRIDPYIRIYSRLMVPTGDYAEHKSSIVHSIGTLLSEYYLHSPQWDDNNQDRTAEVVVDTENFRSAFFLLDCLAEANLRPQIPFTNRLDSAPMALIGDVCAGKVDVDFPVLPGTGFQSLINQIWIQFGFRQDFETIVHEYGHHEMWEAYGKLVFGDYSRTQTDHNFNGECEDTWTAFAEAWADFCPVITRGYPAYRGIDLENELPGHTMSDRCEGTICRIFWDIWDTFESPTVKGVSGKMEVAQRPLTAGLRLDDDPVGFTDSPPFGAWRGRSRLKSIIAREHPKSIWDFKAAWNKRFAQDGLARRALEAIFWQHGLRQGITNSAPSCTLTVEGARSGDTYTGPLILRAATLDADITESAPYDGQLMHVAFYYAHYLEPVGEISGSGPEDWYPIGMDIRGSDGFGVEWPEAARRPPENQKIVLIAVASDFFERSTYGYKKAKFTTAQFGPILVKKADAGAGGGGLKPSGPLTEVGYFSIGGSAYGIRVHDDKLYIAAWGQGLLIVDISQPESPKLISKFQPSDIDRTDTCRDVDLYDARSVSGGRGLFAVLAYGSAGMRIVDVTDPKKPIPVGGLGGDHVYSSRVRIVGDHALFWDTGRVVVDISNPSRPGPAVPWLQTRLRANRYEVKDIAVRGDDVFLACGDRGLAVLDLAEILNLKMPGPGEDREEMWLKMIKGSYSDGHDLRDLEILDEKSSGRRLAACLFRRKDVPEQDKPKAGACFMRVLDVTDLRNIKAMETFDLEGFPDDVAVDGPNLMVGHSGGVTLFDFADPGTPKKIGDFKGSFTYTGGEIAFYGNYAIVLVANDHLGILKLKVDNWRQR